jgi:hypothetical protein
VIVLGIDITVPVWFAARGPPVPLWGWKPRDGGLQYGDLMRGIVSALIHLASCSPALEAIGVSSCSTL